MISGWNEKQDGQAGDLPAKVRWLLYCQCKWGLCLMEWGLVVLTVVCTPLPPINMIAALVGHCFQCFLPV